MDQKRPKPKSPASTPPPLPLGQVLRRHWPLLLAPAAGWTVCWFSAFWLLGQPQATPLEQILPSPSLTAQAQARLEPVGLDLSNPYHPKLRAIPPEPVMKSFIAFLNTDEVMRQIYHQYAATVKTPLPSKDWKIFFHADPSDPTVLEVQIQVNPAFGSAQDAQVLAQTALDLLPQLYRDSFIGPQRWSQPFHQEQLAQSEAQLKAATQRISTFKADHGLTHPPLQLALSAQSVAHLQTLLHLNENTQKASLQERNALARSLGIASPSAEDLRQLLAQRSDLLSMGNHLAQIAVDYTVAQGQTDPAPTALQGQIAEATTLHEAMQEAVNNSRLLALQHPSQQTSEHTASTPPTEDENIQPAGHVHQPNPATLSDAQIIPAIDTGSPSQQVPQLIPEALAPLTETQLQQVDALAMHEVSLQGQQVKLKRLRQATQKAQQRFQQVQRLTPTLAALETRRQTLEETYDYWARRQEQEAFVHTLFEETLTLTPLGIDTPHSAPSPPSDPTEKGPPLSPQSFWIGLGLSLLLGLAAVWVKGLGLPVGNGCPITRHLSERMAQGRQWWQNHMPHSLIRPFQKTLSPSPGLQPGVRQTLTLDLAHFQNPLQFLADLNTPEHPLQQNFQSLYHTLQSAPESPPAFPWVSVCGSSLIAAGLAIAAAQQGKRVCLVEFTEESSILSGLFPLELTWGVSDLAQQTLTLEEWLPLAQADSPVRNLVVMPQGTQRLPVGKRIAVLEALRQEVPRRFDWAILCLPALDASPSPAATLKAVRPDTLLWLDSQPEKASPPVPAKLAKLLADCHVYQLTEEETLEIGS